ncbi:MAG: c-type cytochrome [Thermodesulfobacteriota bacterium]|nr:c-type cytochrome [Thermodesulfobacteriota bacterium]
MKKTAVCAILLAVSVSAYAKNGGPVHSITLPTVETKMADGEGKVVMAANCSSCHSLDYIVMQPKLSPKQWTGTVNKMRKVFGANISDADAAVIATYLASNYGPGSKTEAAAQGKDAAPKVAMNISGEASFKKYCVACHAGGGNVIRPAKTLHRKDRETNGIKTAADIVRLLRNPGPGMPEFDVKSVPDTEAKAIARYVIDTFK